LISSARPAVKLLGLVKSGQAEGLASPSRYRNSLVKPPKAQIMAAQGPLFVTADDNRINFILGDKS
jgi:hypothetical protein